MTEKEMITMIVDTLLVFYYEKMVGYMPSSFAYLVFVGKRIEVGLKRGKFDHPALINKKLGANGESKDEGGTNTVTAIPTCQIPHQLNNVNTHPISALLITHHPISQERVIIHKGHL